jgi:hypothetical protein
MKKYEHLRKKALEFRNRNFSLGDICERLRLPKTTVYYWIKDVDVPLRKKERTQKQKNSWRYARAVFQKKCALKREDAYNQGAAEFHLLSQDRSFIDFVVAYICEGYKKSRNTVSIANSDLAVILLGHKWIKKFTSNKIDYSLQFHVDQDIEKLKIFWADNLGIELDKIRIQRKSNSGKMSKRNWRSEYGVFTVRSNDTYFRSRLQAWIDFVRKDWLNRV